MRANRSDQVQFSAVVLAGGAAARLDGADKASVELRGRRLLEYAVDALLDAWEVVVAGRPARGLPRPVTFTREDPAHGGPVAGFLTGLDALRHPARQVGVLAVDMPHVTPRTLRRLREAAPGHDGAFLVDEQGRHQLAGVLDAAALAGIRPGPEEQHQMPWHRLVAPLDLADVPAVTDEAIDVDTWADLRRLREDDADAETDHR